MDKIRTTVNALTVRTGLSQARIAQWLGVPPKTFHAWLSGRVTCRHKKMLELALEALSSKLEGIATK